MRKHTHEKEFQEVALILSNFNPHNYNNEKTQGHKILKMKSFSHRRISTTVITLRNLDRICKCFTLNRFMYIGNAFFSFRSPQNILDFYVLAWMYHLNSSFWASLHDCRSGYQRMDIVVWIECDSACTWSEETFLCHVPHITTQRELCPCVGRWHRKRDAFFLGSPQKRWEMLF